MNRDAGTVLDEYLVLAARSGSADAFRRLWATHGARATTICYRLYDYVTSQIARTLGRHRGDWAWQMRWIAPRT